MILVDCPHHHPPCSHTATRFACSQRTMIESAVRRGLIERGSAERLLAKYGVPMSPMTATERYYEEQNPQGKLSL